jgi:hypothetical protein
MPRLNDLQAVMHRVLRDALPVAEGAALLGVDPGRLAIYHRFVHRHVQQALEANFPVTLAALPAATREALHADYFAAHPPGTWSLDAAAAAFPAFLEARAGAEPPTPFHAALAHLEWALSEVYHDPAELPVPQTTLLNPTLTVLESVYPVAAYLAAVQAGGAPPEAPVPLPAPTLTLVFRHPIRETACFFAATDALLFALKVAHDALDPVQVAAQLGLDPNAALEAMRAGVDCGLLLAPPPANPPQRT